MLEIIVKFSARALRRKLWFDWRHFERLFPNFFPFFIIKNYFLSLYNHKQAKNILSSIYCNINFTQLKERQKVVILNFWIPSFINIQRINSI